MKARSVAKWTMAVVLAGLTLGSVVVQAQGVGPAANTTAANARVIVPDGELAAAGGGEPGRGTLVRVRGGAGEDLRGGGGRSGERPGGEHDWQRGVVQRRRRGAAGDELDCTLNTRAPALQVASDGMRCVLQTLPPSIGNAQNKRGVYVAVTSVAGPSFQIRVRRTRSTAAGRPMVMIFMWSCRTRRRTPFASRSRCTRDRAMRTRGRGMAGCSRRCR